MDFAGNVGTGTLTVTVVLEEAADTTPPILTVSDVSFPITNSTGMTGYNLYNLSYPWCGGITTNCTYYSNVSATDDVGLERNQTQNDTRIIAPSCTPDAWSIFPIGTTTVTCTVSDDAGNVATESFTVTVTLEAGDTTPPVVEVADFRYGVPIPSEISISDTNSTGQSYGWILSVSDAGNVPVPTFPAKSIAVQVIIVVPTGNHPCPCPVHPVKLWSHPLDPS